jgi:hypothetical protein
MKYYILPYLWLQYDPVISIMYKYFQVERRHTVSAIDYFFQRSHDAPSWGCQQVVVCSKMRQTVVSGPAPTPAFWKWAAPLNLYKSHRVHSLLSKMLWNVFIWLTKFNQLLNDSSKQSIHEMSLGEKVSGTYLLKPHKITLWCNVTIRRIDYVFY